MLITFGGLPGVGKTTLARELARHLSAVYLRIDTIEQAIVASGFAPDTVGRAGYYVGYAVAGDNLFTGETVVADSVNPLAATRDAWKSVAQRAGVELVEIEVICSDPAEHRRRVETRESDIPGHRLPNWGDIRERQYDPWQREHLVIDTSVLSPLQAVEDIIARLPATAPAGG